MVTNCLAGCIAGFSCIGGVSPNLPLPGEILSPVIITTWTLRDTVITVGNKSSEQLGHHAAIKSFEYGIIDGHLVKLEIVDEQGGAFSVFTDHLTKCIQASEKEIDITLECQFGWVALDCNGNTTRSSLSPKITVIPLTLDVSYAGGIAKYHIEASDSIQKIFVSKEDITIGTDDNKVSLKEAIKKLCIKHEPKLNVIFGKRNADGTFSNTDWDFKNPIPKCVWAADNHNKLVTIHNWINPFITENDKGVFITVDNTGSFTNENQKLPTIILWEAIKTGNCSAETAELGTFIVNGGNCSNVLEFNPKMSWIPSLAIRRAPTGGAVSRGTSAALKVSERGDGQGPKAGATASIPSTRPAFDCHGPINEKSKTDKNSLANDDAQKSVSQETQPIRGELKIHGNPLGRYVDVRDIIGKKLSIVFINPFHIFPNGNDCGKWLAKPTCNNVLSNKTWEIRGAHHSIKGDTYVTTLQVVLLTPAIDLPPGSNFGNNPSGYITIGDCQEDFAVAAGAVAAAAALAAKRIKG